MSLTLKESRNATYNYTKRSNIGLKNCNVTIIDQNPDQMRVKLSLDLKNINLQPEHLLVLEAVYKGKYFRQKLINPKSELELYINDFPEDSNPSFRLKHLPELDGGDGRIISSTKFFKAKRADGKTEKRNNFLSFDLTDQTGGLIWKVNWQDEQNPQIFLNENFAKQYDPKSDYRVHAFILPALIREILIGIFLRFDSIDEIEERSQASRWLKFCDRKLIGWSLPDKDDWEDKVRLSELAEQAALLFSEKKWDGNRTFLEKLLDKTWKI